MQKENANNMDIQLAFGVSKSTAQGSPTLEVAMVKFCNTRLFHSLNSLCDLNLIIDKKYGCFL